MILIGILILLGVLYYAPWLKLVGVPYYVSEDTFSHFNRMMVLENVWSAPVNYHAFAGDGNYTNLFYPWLMMYPMWIFAQLTGSLTLGYKLYYLCLGILTLLIAFYSMEKLTGDETAAFCFAVLYGFSAYRFADVFVRGALGESISLTVLPLILWGACSVFFGDTRHWRPLTIGMTVLLYGHLLSAFMAGLMLMLLGLASLFFNRDKGNAAVPLIRRFLTLFRAALWSLALSLGFLIPMFEALHNNVIQHPDAGPVMLSEHADPLHSILLSSLLNSPTAHHIGLLTLLAGLFAALALIRRSRKHSGEVLQHGDSPEVCADTGAGAADSVSLLFLAFGACILVFTSSLMPWDFFASHTPLHILQFPWRLHGHSTLLILAAACLLLPSFLKGRIRLLLPAGIVCLALILHFVSIVRIRPLEETRITDEVLSTMHFYTNTDYAPKEEGIHREKYGYTMDSYYLDGEEFSPEERISEDGGKVFIRFRHEEKEQALDVPVFWYTTLKVFVNDRETPSALSERGTPLIRVPADRDIEVVLYHEYTPLTRFAWGISLCALLLFISLYIIKERS